ncbi:MAG: metal ABC transporter permease [Verrucomicrobiota bacterium]
MEWTGIDTWIVITAALVAMACAIPGVFLFLSKQSMFGHGVVHSVLPGLVIAFLITSSRDLTAVLIGAMIAAILTAVLTQLVHETGKVEEGASLGVVFTSMFALGILLIRATVDTVHIDPDCVLFGILETSVIDAVLFDEIPKVAINSAIMLVVNLLLAALFIKELRIATFDPALASAMGLRPRLVNYGVMISTAVTAVLAFESVGSILVIAMMIAPAATAYLLTSRLLGMLVCALGIAVLTAVSGHLFSLFVPSAIFQILPGGIEVDSTNIAGGMSVMAGILFIAALLFSPGKGIISKYRAQKKLGESESKRRDHSSLAEPAEV